MGRIDPDAQLIAAKPPKGRRRNRCARCHIYGGNVRTLVAFSTILGISRVPWGSLGFRSPRTALISPYGHPLAPTPHGSPRNRRMGDWRRRHFCARSRVKGECVYTSGVYPYFGVPWRPRACSSPSFPPYGLQLTPTPNVLPRDHRRSDGRRRRPRARIHLEWKMGV